MRVLIVPELYRPRDASANATLEDAVTWVREWLRLDASIHVYWLLPRQETANYRPTDVLADHERVTLVEADHLMVGHRNERLFTETGYTGAQLRAVKREIYDRHGYVDVVIDQLRHGSETLAKWLLHLAGHQPGRPRPFDLIVNAHDVMLPFKYADDGHRDTYQRRLEMARIALADGCWFKARCDARRLPEFAEEFLRPEVVDEALEHAVMTDSPIEFDRFDERYADRPRWLHVAGSSWKKKRRDVVMSVAADLHRRYGIETVMTSMDDVTPEYARLPWVEAHSRASRETYEAALRRGDIAVCATEHDTLARTWFEQAASGQVLVVRDEPWVHDCVPTDSPLLAPLEGLHERTRWVVEHWPAAVAANRRLVAHVRRVRSPERTGRRTLADLHRRVAAKSVQPAPGVAAAVERTATPSVSLDDLAASVAATQPATADGAARAANPSRHPQGSADEGEPPVADLVAALRADGYHDVGNAGTPVFRRQSSSAD